MVFGAIRHFATFNKRKKLSRKDNLKAQAFSNALKKSKHKRAARHILSPFRQTKRSAKRLWKYYTRHRHELRSPIFLILWLGWLFIGTFFYAYAPKSNLGLVRGFYMSLNIGYSIGFGYPSEEHYGQYLWFSIWYVLCGASFVGVALGFFADGIAQDNQSWFTRLEQQKKIEAAIKKRETYYLGQVHSWMYHCRHALRALSVWFFFICSMVTYSSIAMKWPMRESLYFAISSLSTGGHWAIPPSAPDWIFGVTACHIMFGVPVMGAAMAQLAMMFIEHVGLDEAKATIDEIVTREELVFLHELGLENFDGEIDKAEYIILCMVRLGTDPGLIQYITERFSELNFYSGRSLSVAQITHGECKYVNGKIRRRESLLESGMNTNTLHTVTEHEIVCEDDFAVSDFFHEEDEESSFAAEYRMSYMNFRPSMIPASIMEVDFEDETEAKEEEGDDDIEYDADEEKEEEKANDNKKNKETPLEVFHDEEVSSHSDKADKYLRSNSPDHPPYRGPAGMDHDRGPTGSDHYRGTPGSDHYRGSAAGSDHYRGSTAGSEHKASTSSETSFLRSLVEKFGLPSKQKTDSTTASSTGCNEVTLDEIETGNGSLTASNPISRFVSDLIAPAYQSLRESPSRLDTDTQPESAASGTRQTTSTWFGNGHHQSAGESTHDCHKRDRPSNNQNQESNNRFAGYLCRPSFEAGTIGFQYETSRRQRPPDGRLPDASMLYSENGGTASFVADPMNEVNTDKSGNQRSQDAVSLASRSTLRTPSGINYSPPPYDRVLAGSKDPLHPPTDMHDVPIRYPPPPDEVVVATNDTGRPSRYADLPNRYPPRTHEIVLPTKHSQPRRHPPPDSLEANPAQPPPKQMVYGSAEPPGQSSEYTSYGQAETPTRRSCVDYASFLYKAAGRDKAKGDSEMPALKSINHLEYDLEANGRTIT